MEIISLFIIPIVLFIIVFIYAINRDKSNSYKNNKYKNKIGDDFESVDYGRKETAKKAKKSDDYDFSKEYESYYIKVLDASLSGDKSATDEIRDEFGDFNPEDF